MKIPKNVSSGGVHEDPHQPMAYKALLNYIEECVIDLSHEFPAASIILAGDLNQLADGDVMDATGLLQIVRKPTRGMNLLDRVFVSHPIFRSVRVVTSAVRSDHKAIVAYAEL